MKPEMRLRERVDSGDLAHWLRHGSERLRGVNTLSRGGVEHGAGLISILHHGVELYLKGYLLARGWQQEKTKSLVKLLDAAIRFDSRFAAFRDSLAELNRDFRLANYPGGDRRKVSDHFEVQKQQANKLVALIRSSVPQYFPQPPTK
jgi:HEPN domain-containing protein